MAVGLRGIEYSSSCWLRHQQDSVGLRFSWVLYFTSKVLGVVMGCCLSSVLIWIFRLITEPITIDIDFDYDCEAEVRMQDQNSTSEENEIMNLTIVHLIRVSSSTQRTVAVTWLVTAIMKEGLGWVGLTNTLRSWNQLIRSNIHVQMIINRGCLLMVEKYDCRPQR